MVARRRVEKIGGGGGQGDMWRSCAFREKGAAHGMDGVVHGGGVGHGVLGADVGNYVARRGHGREGGIVGGVVWGVRLEVEGVVRRLLLRRVVGDGGVRVLRGGCVVQLLRGVLGVLRLLRHGLDVVGRRLHGERCRGHGVGRTGGVGRRRRAAGVLVVGEAAEALLDVVGRVLANERVAGGGRRAEDARLRPVVAEHALGADAGRVHVLPELAHQRLGAAALAGRAAVGGPPGARGGAQRHGGGGCLFVIKECAAGALATPSL
ncbi:hypothetical protein FGB62_4g261 [Gracilaria domingensis]|nr:hypothetical protein FGB62_4g261 [Gracilaria domingensis]